ncbi:MAG: V-type ATP synthase subunit I [Oscillibacter sp.]|nr:V-type ATP synthase subunit I [Hominicoprocola fusiformis]MCI7638123.1 V-type ATP synthase subunit I [Oscillibacter sp.]MEE0541766.1 V-type ATP synthase subunit I [Oscillospiraceae bacterium]HCQ52066.1 V-type ATP synthase subunit I [Oscillibacter sp.]
MAIVAMKHLRLLGMESEREALLKAMQDMECVEISSIDGSEEALKSGFAKPDDKALMSAQEASRAYRTALASLDRFAPEKKGMFRKRQGVSRAAFFSAESEENARTAAETINKDTRRLGEIESERTKNEALRATLAPWLTVDAPLGGADGALAVFFGTAGLNVTDDALKALADSLDGLLTWQQASSDRSLRYLLVMCHGSVKERALSALRDLGFSTVSFRGMTGTAKENDKALAENLAALEKERQEIEQRIAGLGGKREALLEASDRAAIALRREEAKSRLVGTDKVFLLEGWLPADRCAEIEKTLKPFTCAIETREPTEDEYPQVPVQLKNNKLTRPLNMVTEMYSLPAYGTLDPNPLMAPFFILFYGIMMADMGYGLLMMIASVIISKKYRPKGTSGELFSLLGLCGISTFIMGALTGGFFGDFLTQLVAIVSPGTVFALPKLFDPLDDLTMILIGSMALGMVQIVTGMAISLIEKCKRKKFLDAFFEEITWWIVFIGIALLALGKGAAVLYVGCALVLLGPIVQGKGWGKLTGVFGSLYNHVTGYFGDILSYTRLMALMLAGSVIAQVFNMLAAMPGNVIAFIIISMLGNAMNFGLNLLGCYVHDLRLQCLEFFNKFYVDGGKPFRPMTLDTEYVDLQ